MHTPRLTYGHMLAPVNEKHVASLLDFFERGINSGDQRGFGIEIEHLPVRNSDDTAVAYFDRNGVETVMNRIRPYYDPAQEYWENGYLVGLGRDGIGISLEPGGQIEVSIGIVHSSHELREIYDRFRHEIDPMLDDLNMRLVEYGYQPRTRAMDITINPKNRYTAMTEYLGRVGQFGPCMMRGSASTQVSIDYFSEQDSIEKARVGTAIGPLLAWFYRNTPYFEGERNEWPLMRQRMWAVLDVNRTGVSPGLYDPRYSWREYALNVLSTPLMFADLTHTPETAGLPAERREFAEFHHNAAEIYPDRRLNDYEINHLLSTHFNDVRLKNFLEFRHWDSLPIERVERLTDTIGDLFYNRDNFQRLVDYFDGLREEDVVEAKAMLQAHSGDAKPYGKDLDFWHDFLNVGDTAADVPGDSAHPDVFQS